MMSTSRLCLLLVFAAAGCRVESNAERVEIISALAPTATCSFTDGTLLTQGFYDPTINDGAGYTLGLSLRNNMVATAVVPAVATSSDAPKIDGVAHDVQVIGAKGCWYDSDALGSSQKAEINCKDFPGQSASFSVSGTVAEGAGTTAISLQVLEMSHLRALYGAAFAPADIPAKGAYRNEDPSLNPQILGLPQNTATVLIYDYAAQDAASATRSAAWGTFPASGEAVVHVQVSLHFQLQDGSTFWSDAYVFPVTICPRCLQSSCGLLVQKTCAKGPCADGTQCLNTGTCANPTMTCSATTLFSGSRPTFDSGACLPAQGLPGSTPPVCLPTGCDASQ